MVLSHCLGYCSIEKSWGCKFGYTRSPTFHVRIRKPARITRPVLPCWPISLPLRPTTWPMSSTSTAAVYCFITGLTFVFASGSDTPRCCTTFPERLTLTSATWVYFIGRTPSCSVTDWQWLSLTNHSEVVMDGWPSYSPPSSKAGQRYHISKYVYKK